MKTLFFIALCLACVLVEVSSLDKPVNLDGSCPSGYYEDLALCLIRYFCLSKTYIKSYKL